MQKYLADTNIIIRTLVDEGTPMNRKTIELLEEVNAGNAELIVEDLVVVEAAWVLKAVYKVDRVTIAKALLQFLNSKGVDCSKTILTVLRTHQLHNLDLVDIYLAETSKFHNIPVVTWDGGFKKLDAEYYNPGQIVPED